MSDEASAIARNHSLSTGTARLVLLGIANHDSDGGASIHMATLATYANVTLRNAQKAVERLAGHTAECRAKTRQTGEPCALHLDVPEIRRVVNGGGRVADPNHERPNLYEFLLECPPRCDRTKFHRIRCDRCGEPVPHDRRLVGTHRRCALQVELAGRAAALAAAEAAQGSLDAQVPAAPPVDPELAALDLTELQTPPVATDTRTNTSVETGITSYVPERGRARELRPIPLEDRRPDACPKRLGSMPHTWVRGRCIDCHTTEGSPASTTADSAAELVGQL